MEVAGNELTLEIYDYKPCMKANIKAALEDDGYKCSVKSGVIVAKRMCVRRPIVSAPARNQRFLPAGT